MHRAKRYSQAILKETEEVSRKAAKWNDKMNGLLQRSLRLSIHRPPEKYFQFFGMA
jgi:hypothetical protein